MMRWTIYQMMGRYQTRTGRRLTVAELAREAGLPRSVVLMAANGYSKRVDLKTLDRLLDFFSRELESATAADLLEFVPDQPQP